MTKVQLKHWKDADCQLMCLTTNKMLSDNQ